MDNSSKYNLKLNLIDGQFAPKEALEIMTKLFDIKIKYHQNHDIENDGLHEDRIKALQKSLFEFQRYLEKHNSSVKIEAKISIN